MTPLSPHFSLEEMTASVKADELGIDNAAPPEIVDALRATCAALEDVRTFLGHAMSVNSGYRCPTLNTAVDGSATSDHMKGLACDFTCAPFGTPLDICKALAGAGLPFDQLIEEGTWVHIGFGPGMRGEVLTKRPGGGYDTGLTRKP